MTPAPQSRAAPANSSEHRHLVVEVRGATKGRRAGRAAAAQSSGDGWRWRSPPDRGGSGALQKPARPTAAQGAAGQFGVASIPVPAAEVRVAAGEAVSSTVDPNGIVLELTQPGPAQRSLPRMQQGGVPPSSSTAPLAGPKAGQGGQQGRLAGALLRPRMASVSPLATPRLRRSMMALSPMLTRSARRPIRGGGRPSSSRDASTAGTGRPARRSARSARRPATAAGTISVRASGVGQHQQRAAGQHRGRQQQALVVAGWQPHQVGHDQPTKPTEPAVVTAAVSQRSRAGRPARAGDRRRRRGPGASPRDSRFSSRAKGTASEERQRPGPQRAATAG